MDEKYSGCNIVESVVTNVQKIRIEKKKERRHGRLYRVCLRLVAVAAIVGCIAFIGQSTSPAVTPIRGILRDIFRYDVFGQVGFGITSAFYK